MARQKRKHVALVESEWRKLQQFSEAKGLPMTKCISWLIDEFESMQRVRRAFYDSSIDIALWYCEKLAFSVQALKMNKTKEQLQRTLKLLEQIKRRYRVDVSLLHDVVTAFMADSANVIVLNEALKETMKAIVRRVMLNE